MIPNCKVKIYPNGTQKYVIFNYPKFQNKERNIENIPKEYNTDSVVRADSLKRARENIFDIAYINSDLWSYMITFTLDKRKIDRYDKSEIKKYVQQWLKNQVKRKSLCYLIVPEYHKDGAIHFHGLINNSQFNFVDSGRVDSSGRVIYNISDWNIGFSTAVKLDDKKIAVCKYITKYITKGNEKIFGSFYWFGGKDLKRDVVTEYISIDYDSFDVPEFDIPNTDIKVKYVTEGVFFDD